MKHLSNKRTLVILLLLFSLLNSVSALSQICWYYTPVVVNNNGAALTNYPVLVTLNTQALIAGGKLRSDAGDLRFETSLGSGVYYSHWIESGLNTSETRVWVKVPTVPATSAITIYLRHGNPGLTYANDPTTVFPAYINGIATPPTYQNLTVPLDNVYIQFSFYDDGFSGFGKNLWGGIMGSNPAKALLVGVREGSGPYSNRYWYTDEIDYQANWYLNGNFGNPLPINRSVGWHTVKMVLSNGRAKIYFDDYESVSFPYSAATYSATDFRFYSLGQGHTAQFDKLFYFNYPVMPPAVVVGTIMPSEPTSQPTSLEFSSVTTRSVAGKFLAAPGGPSGYLVLRKERSGPTALPTDGITYTVGTVLGDGSVIVHAGAGLMFTDNTLNPCTEYYYQVFAYNENTNSGCIDYLTNSPLSTSETTLSQSPTGQPTSLSLVAGASAIAINFSAASGPVTGYLILRSTTGTPNTPPSDGTYYNRGDRIGNALVASTGATTSFNDNNLSACTNYYYSIYTVNQNGSCIDYSTNDLTGNLQTLSAEPQSQPSSLQFDQATYRSINVKFTASTNNVSGYLALRAIDVLPNTHPSDGMTYMAGDRIGNATVAYVGAQDNFQEAGLLSCTNYQYRIYSYIQSGSAACIDYLTTSPLTGNQTTESQEPNAQATAMNFSSVSTDRMMLRITPPSTRPTGFLVMRKKGSPPTFIPSDNVQYTTGDQVSAPGGIETVAYAGSLDTFSETGLESCTNYFYTVFSYNQNGNCLDYLISSPLTSNQKTNSSEPQSQPTSLDFNNIKDREMQLIFDPAPGNVTGYLVLRAAGALPNVAPADGETYQAGDALGNATIISTNSTTAFIDSNLLPCTLYYYAIYSYRTNGDCIDYLTSTPALSASQRTRSVEPGTQPSSLIFENVSHESMSIRFTQATSRPTGYLVLRSVDLPPDTPPSDGVGYNVGEVVGNAKVAYSGPNLYFNDLYLDNCTNYHYRVYSYNQVGSCTDYLISLPLTGSQSTSFQKPEAQPTVMVFSDITTDGMRVQFTHASPRPPGYVVIRAVGSIPTSVPSDGTRYAAGQTLGNGTIAYVGPSTEFIESGLTSCTNYYYRIYSYNASGSCISYLTTAPLSVNQATAGSQRPTSQPTTLRFSPSDNSTITVSYSAASGFPSGYLVLKKSGSTPTSSPPVDGTFYSVGSRIGDTEVVYVGPELSFVENISGSCVDEYYAIYSFNDGGACIQYLLNSPLTGHYTNKLTPSINSVSPTLAQEGETVMIKGSNFSEIEEENIVRFNDVIATIISSTPNEIICTVPIGATTGRITVQVCDIQTLSPDKFTVYSNKMIISNLLSPYERDGINDELYIKNIEFTVYNRVMLLDRYGVVINEWENFKNSHDPLSTDHFDITQLPPGNYLCILDYQLPNDEFMNRQTQMVTLLNH
jgi:hypothetical protein